MEEDIQTGNSNSNNNNNNNNNNSPTPPQKYQKLCYINIPIFITKETSRVLLLLLPPFLLLLIFFLYITLINNPFFQSQATFLGQFLQNSQTPDVVVCDYSYGKWVWDESYPRRKYTENCPFLDPGFRCHFNGRIETNYQKWRWIPQGCHLPRFNASDLLNRYRNGRIVFAGDSIGRNQWESLVCMLAQGVSNQSTIYEVNGSPITKHKGFLLMRFGEYNLTVEYYRAPFLVVLDRPPKNASQIVRGAIRVDKLHWYSTKWVGADLLLFSAGHWWNPDKTIKSGHYFQEGTAMNMTMDVTEAFRRSLNTLMHWAMRNLNPEQSQIIFRSYSPVHYRDGAWNEGGQCSTYVTPEKDVTELKAEPLNNEVISELIKQTKTAQFKPQFLNITYLTELRRDGHPSSHREQGTPPSAPQDCSHWCLPGVPDAWNELLYAHLLSK